MCIVLLATSHPKYCLIVLSNRDEFLSRPTKRLSEWEIHSRPDIYGGLDLGHSDKVLTNVREPPGVSGDAKHSRGLLVKSFLTFEKSGSITDWINYQFPSAAAAANDDGSGDCSNSSDSYAGFSLICSVINRQDTKSPTTKLAIISNRSSSGGGGSGGRLDKKVVNDQVVEWIGENFNVQQQQQSCVCGLSNSPFGSPWEKVTNGQRLLSAAIEDSLSQKPSGEEEFVEKLFGILSTTAPAYDPAPTSMTSAAIGLSQTIFVPATSFSNFKSGGSTSSGESQMYGTRQQSVILVGKEDGAVHFIERTVYNDDGEDSTTCLRSSDRDREVKFTI